MIQNIAPHKFSNAYSNRRPEATDFALCFNDRTVLLHEQNGAIRFPRFNELTGDTNTLLQTATYLFAIDNDRFYWTKQPAKEQGDFRLKDISVFRKAFPRHSAFAGITAYSLYKWYDNHRFCSHCGERLVPHNKERMMYCEKCGNSEYPKIMPAVIVAVTNGDKILLSKYATGNTRDMLSLPGLPRSANP